MNDFGVFNLTEDVPVEEITCSGKTILNSINKNISVFEGHVGKIRSSKKRKMFEKKIELLKKLKTEIDKEKSYRCFNIEDSSMLFFLVADKDINDSNINSGAYNNYVEFLSLGKGLIAVYRGTFTENMMNHKNYELVNVELFTKDSLEKYVPKNMSNNYIDLN